MFTESGRNKERWLGRYNTVGSASLGIKALLARGLLSLASQLSISIRVAMGLHVMYQHLRLSSLLEILSQPVAILQPILHGNLVKELCVFDEAVLLGLRYTL